MVGRRMLTEQLGLVEMFESRGFRHVTVEGGPVYVVWTHPAGSASHGVAVIGKHDEIALFVDRIEESIAAAVRGE